jgi:dTDP-4-amino-4,6-dideoxygalactose transaminase
VEAFTDAAPGAAPEVRAAAIGVGDASLEALPDAAPGAAPEFRAATIGVMGAPIELDPDTVRDAARPAVPAQDLVRHNKPMAGALQAAALRVLASGRYIQPPASSQSMSGSPPPPSPLLPPSPPSSSASPPLSEVRAFEEEVALALGVEHAVGVSSGTDAILAMLMAVGVGPGDEVVTTPFSFIATAAAIARLGARPAFADVEPATLILDPDAAAARVGPRTKALLTVHLFGRAARSEHLVGLCAARGIPLLEDAAQAIGAADASGCRVGAIGRGAALSFFPTKNLGGFGDAGMVITNDAALAASVRLLRTHGAASRFHHVVLGGNFRLDELQAALLRVKLPRLAAWTTARRGIAGIYHDALCDLPLDVPPPDPGCVWNQFVVRVPNGRRDALAAFLARNRIATAVYYPEPLHLQPCFATLGHRPGDFPIAERASAEVLALPIYPELTADQILAVTAAIREFYS